MPTNPGFGTGYVDWGNYVNANQATSDRDRQQVSDYLGGQDTKARQAASAAFSGPGYGSAQGQTGGGNPPANANAWTGQGPSSPVTNYNTLYSDLATNQEALKSPEGFQQVLGRAKANYDPTNTDPKNKAPAAAGNSFDAALEGQNASKLYGGIDSLDSYAKSFTGTPPPVEPAPTQSDPGTNDKEDQPAGGRNKTQDPYNTIWNRYQNKQNKKGTP